MKDQRIFISTTDETYINLAGLQVLKTGTKEVLWDHVDMQHLTLAPLFTKDKIFLRNGDNFSGTAYALDRKNGRLLWEIPSVIGNLVYSPDTRLVYALQESGNLLAIDEDSGKESVITKFSSSPFIFFDGVDNCGYQLSYDEKEHILVVYTGDSRQLFAFKEK